MICDVDYRHGASLCMTDWQEINKKEKDEIKKCKIRKKN